MERTPVSRRSLVALGAAALTILSITAGTASAHDEDDQFPYRACITAKRGAWLFAVRCHHDHHHHCMRPVRRGLAFRVLGQKGGYLLVRNWRGRGWIELNSVRFAPQAYCRAAGI
jgi:hypothetical protein